VDNYEFLKKQVDEMKKRQEGKSEKLIADMFAWIKDTDSDGEFQLFLSHMKHLGHGSLEELTQPKEEDDDICLGDVETTSRD